LPPRLSTATKFQSNPSSHLGVVSALSPDGQTGFVVYCGLDFSFAYLQIQASLEFG
jgi:hypothetical protein